MFSGHTYIHIGFYKTFNPIIHTCIYIYICMAYCDIVLQMPRGMASLIHTHAILTQVWLQEYSLINTNILEEVM